MLIEDYVSLLQCERSSHDSIPLVNEFPYSSAVDLVYYVSRYIDRSLPCDTYATRSEVWFSAYDSTTRVVLTQASESTVLVRYGNRCGTLVLKEPTGLPEWLGWWHEIAKEVMTLDT
jgi:hypothetical protein